MTDSTTTDHQPFDSIVHRFLDRVEKGPRRSAMRHQDGGRWIDTTWAEYGAAVSQTAAGLIGLGVSRGDRVVLLGSNSPLWHVADLAILMCGAVSVPIYPMSSSSQVAYVIENSGAEVCFASDGEQAAKILLHADDFPQSVRIVVLDSTSGLDRPGRIETLEQIRAAGDVDVVAERARQIRSEDVATLVYTSGTTGPPKGAMLSHANITWTIDAVTEMVGLRSDDRMLSYLPLSHIAERITSHFGMLAAGGQTWFARSLASVPEDLRACRPTIFMAVPRVWQKLHDSIVEELDSTPVHLSGLVDRVAKLELDPGLPWWSIAGLATAGTRFSIDQTLGKVIRRRVGLDRARLLVSAAAPIHPDLVRWFAGVGLPIAEVYGQTEDCGPATVNPPGAIRIGSVGLPIPGLEAKAADDGELLFRGGSVCVGYHELPEATDELIDAERWLHSGDLGYIDDDGYIWITGRKKDLIVNAAGKNIAPSEIEAALSMEALIGQAVVVGEGQRFLTALIALDGDAVSEWARRHGTFGELADLVHDEGLSAEIAASVRRVNAHHAPAEQIKYWRLLTEQLTIENGELTPPMKVKRQVVRDRHSDLIEEMYALGSIKDDTHEQSQVPA
ncbi:MAG: long-chain fatty acid--CoA ligase [Ilumatobacter sp.]|uniref:AMP-dependent synthetase/ligase n=1 Tax=Ilumatobacter sp. TaxID=1967498 RepID=UPI003299EC17